MAGEPLRICFLTYRGNPRSGGQGVYAHWLTKELVALGHKVDVWSGPPYPELSPGVGFVEVPSLDLWNEAALLRTPSLHELRDPINRSEWAKTLLGGFPEPVTFSRRVALSFRNGSARRYDIVHDNQCLGPGLLEMRSHLPVVATIHHPITVDRRIALRNSTNLLQRYGLWRWYSFLSVQTKVSRRLDRILTVSDAASRDLQREYGIRAGRIQVVGNGVDLDVFRPMPEVQRRQDRLITTLSADSPLKGFKYLLNALAELRRTHPNLTLTVIGKPGIRTGTSSRIRRLGLQDAIHFTGRLEASEMAGAYAEATIAVVPSLYEGFGLPAAEAMACRVPVVASRAGALPEVVGLDEKCGLLVQPRSGESLARAIRTLLNAPERRRAMGETGSERVLSLFSWRKTAERTVDVYRQVIAERELFRARSAQSPSGWRTTAERALEVYPEAIQNRERVRC